MSFQLETSNSTHPEFQILIEKACAWARDMSAFHTYTNDTDDSMDAIPSVLRKTQPVPSLSSQAFLAPPWQRDHWQFTLTPDDMTRIHEALRPPQRRSITKTCQRPRWTTPCYFRGCQYNLPAPVQRMRWNTNTPRNPKTSCATRNIPKRSRFVGCSLWHCTRSILGFTRSVRPRCDVHLMRSAGE